MLKVYEVEDIVAILANIERCDPKDILYISEDDQYRVIIKPHLTKPRQ